MVKRLKACENNISCPQKMVRTSMFFMDFIFSNGFYMWDLLLCPPHCTMQCFTHVRTGDVAPLRLTDRRGEQPSSLKIHSDTPGHGHIVKMAIGEGRFFEHQTGDVFIHFCVMCDVKRYLNIASRAPQRRSLAQKRDSLSVTIRDPLTHICLEESSFSAFCVFIMQSRGEMAVNVRFLRP